MSGCSRRPQISIVWWHWFITYIENSKSKLKRSSDAHFPQVDMILTFTFTFSHLADAFIQSDLQLGNT